MLVISAYWNIGKELKWKEYGKKEVARHNKKMSDIEIEIKADFDIKGWEVEGHFITPFAKSSREFVGLKSTVTEGKVSFALEDTATKYVGDWTLEVILKGPDGEVYTSKGKLKYTVIETAAGMSFNEILSEADSSTVDAAREGLESEITAANTKKTELEGTTADAEAKKQEVIIITSQADTKKVELEEAITTAENTKAELIAENTAGQNTLQAVKDEGGIQAERVIEEGNTQEARLTDHANTQLARFGEPVGDLATRMNNVEAENVTQSEQIQNCVQSLDSSIVAYIGPQGISDNVVGSDVINTGGNVIEGTGISFVKTDDGFGIGEGYENLAVRQATNSSSVTHAIKEGIYEIEATALTDSNSYVQLSQAIIDMITETDYTLSWEVLEGFDNFRHISSSVDAFGSNNFHTTEKGTVTRKTAPTFSGSVAYRVYMLQGLPAGTKLKIKMSITKTGNKVPFVPHSFKGGEMTLDQNYTTDTHSFIFLDYFNRYGSSDTVRFARCESQQFAVQNTGGFDDTKNFDAIVSKSYKQGYQEGEQITVVGQPYGTNKPNFELSHPTTGEKIGRRFGVVVVFDGVKTRDFLEKEYVILKSGNYQLPPHMQGTTFPIEDMTRRGNEDGIVDDTIETDVNRDLWYVDKPSVYKVTDKATAVSTNIIVKDDLSLVGSGLADVSGRLRATSDSYVRKVK